MPDFLSPAFLADEMVSLVACQSLRTRGVDIVHVVEIGLSGVADAEVFQYALENQRIVVTRNYHDFVPLVEVYVRRAMNFPGVIFLATSISPADVGAHVSAIAWFATSELETEAVKNSYRWLSGSQQTS